MGNDPILAWARLARLQPDAVIHDLAAMTAPDRESVLANIQTHYTLQNFRPYTPNTTQAIQQLVANEFMASPGERNWGVFYKSIHNDGCNFLRRYQKIWKAATAAGESNYFSQPDMLTYVLQTVVRSKAEAAPTSGAALLTTPVQTLAEHMGTPITVDKQSVALYICGNYEPTDAGRTLLAEELKWVQDAGYQLPVAVEVKNSPGGYHYYNEAKTANPRKLCDKFPFVGNAVKVGMIPERAPCTARHELSHVVYAQLSTGTRKKVEALFKQAMKADFGLIFNDEHYMVDQKFLHAGHPMQNDSEFFAGALHAYSQHREELMANINNPETPKAVGAYALATLGVLNQILMAQK